MVVGKTRQLLTKKWSNQEENEVKRLYPKMKLKDLAKKLQRSYWSIKRKLDRMGLKKGISEDQRKKVIEFIEKTDFPNDVIAKEVGISINQVRYILRKHGIKRKNGWRQLNLLKGFQYKGNHVGRTRYQLLYVYHNTCWDCKRTFLSEKDLQIHHDFTKLPIQVLVLCKTCHEKRHNVRNRIGD